MIMRYRCSSLLKCWDDNWMYSCSWGAISIGGGCTGCFNRSFVRCRSGVVRTYWRSHHWSSDI